MSHRRDGADLPHAPPEQRRSAADSYLHAKLRRAAPSASRYNWQPGPASARALSPIDQSLREEHTTRRNCFRHKGSRSQGTEHLRRLRVIAQRVGHESEHHAGREVMQSSGCLLVAACHPQQRVVRTYRFRKIFTTDGAEDGASALRQDLTISRAASCLDRHGTASSCVHLRRTVNCLASTDMVFAEEPVAPEPGTPAARRPVTQVRQAGGQSRRIPVNQQHLHQRPRFLHSDPEWGGI
ncbi:hypothetical protein SAMN05216188_1438 [Lentzea xinjiangensis]|uniref:Uncharacterized protein n=1 Tax=Lentzea xinjiangensis TaxID=402600 RepID=A0A1H9WUA4_9PSEU|nr:hypothetical protein SAMN05216188_1438 [Lentzea xinjiangensis]